MGREPNSQRHRTGEGAEATDPARAVRTVTAAPADNDATAAWALVRFPGGRGDAATWSDSVRSLIVHVHGEASRLEAALVVARTWPTANARPDAVARRSRSIHLLEDALAEVINAGAATNARRRARLITQLNGAPHNSSRQGLWHRHSQLRRALRRLDPRWWTQRTAIGNKVSIHIPDHPARHGLPYTVTLRYGMHEVGSATCTICVLCRLARVDDIAIDTAMEGRGLGTGLLRHLRQQFPGYHWLTTPQRVTARSFWLRLQKAYGEYFDGGDSRGTGCPHLDIP